MNIRFPISFPPATPHPAAANLTYGMGRVASFAARAGHLSFRHSEPQRLMFRACVTTAVAATFGSVAALGFVAGWKPFFPMLPMTLLGGAVVWGFETGRYFKAMAAYESRAAMRVTDITLKLAEEIARDRIAQSSREFYGACALEGRQASCGAAAGDGGNASPAADAPNVIRPNFWRQ